MTVDRSADLAHELLAYARTHQDRILIDAGPSGTLTGQQLDAGSGQMAAALADRGVARGDRVLVNAGKSLETVLLYLAVLRIGAIYVPTNTAYTESELRYFVADSEPSLMVLDSGRADGFAGSVDVPVLELSALVETARGLAFLTEADAVPDEPVAMLYTSGTTGRPKGVPLTNENLLSNAKTLVAAWQMSENDVLLHALPVFHAHGLFVALNVALLSGAKVIFHDRFEADRVISDMPRATVFMGVPTFYSRLLAHPDLTKDLGAKMRLFISGSAPLSALQHGEWKDRTGHVILERYGMTETIMCTSNPYDGDRIAGSIGNPLPGVCLRICDPSTGAEVAPGTVGELEVTGPNVFGGYWRRVKDEADFRADGYFRTGDLGHQNADGYVFLSGRAKDVIITGGYNVYPKEVEGVIEATGLVRDVAVFGLPHADFGEAVTAAVVLHDGASLDAERMLSLLRKDIAAFKVPKRVMTVDELPRNALGKVVKADLKLQFAGLYEVPA